MTQSISGVVILTTLFVGIIVAESATGLPTISPATLAFIDHLMTLLVATITFGPVTALISQSLARGGVGLKGP